MKGLNMKTIVIAIFAGLKDSTQNVDIEKLSSVVESSNKVLDGSASIGDAEALCSMAHKILEPGFESDIVTDSYNQFIENNPDRWITIIGSNIGKDWETIARATIAYNG